MKPGQWRMRMLSVYMHRKPNKRDWAIFSRSSYARFIQESIDQTFIDRVHHIKSDTFYKMDGNVISKRRPKKLWSSMQIRRLLEDHKRGT